MPRNLLSLLGPILWFGLGSVVLLGTATRVGVGGGSSFGEARREFQDSWGGPVELSPPRFFQSRDVTMEEWDATVAAQGPLRMTKQEPALIDGLSLDARLKTGVEHRSWLSFTTYELRFSETWTIRPSLDEPAPLDVQLALPAETGVLYDYTVAVGAAEPTRPRLGEPWRLLEAWAPGEPLQVTIRFATRGMELLRYQLSKRSNVVLPLLEADFHVDTPRFELWRFGLPHERTPEGDGERVHFAVRDLVPTQDLGVVFPNERRAQDRVRDILLAAPLALGALLAALGAHGWLRGVAGIGGRLAFPAAAQVFALVFTGILVRHLGLWGALGAGWALGALLFLVTVPAALGGRFTRRVALPYSLLLGPGFSMLFLVPELRAVGLLGLLFGVGLSVLVPVARRLRDE